jgi:hypothetical protein
LHQPLFQLGVSRWRGEEQGKTGKGNNNSLDGRINSQQRTLLKKDSILKEDQLQQPRGGKWREVREWLRLSDGELAGRWILLLNGKTQARIFLTLALFGHTLIPYSMSCFRSPGLVKGLMINTKMLIAGTLAAVSDQGQRAACCAEGWRE